jgi:hypothetical protein
MGVLLYSSFILFLSVCAVAGLATEDTRMLVGGYTYWSRMSIDVLGCLGVVLSSMAIIGVQDNHARWVKLFVYFAVIRVIARGFIFWADETMLGKCEKLGITSVTDHYNRAMETVKLSKSCDVTKFWYTVISVFDIVLSSYALYYTYLWCDYVENSPMYHISIDDTKPIRIYTGYSTVGHPEAPPNINVVPASPPQMSPEDPKDAFGSSMAYSTMHLSPPTSNYLGYGAQGSAPPTLPPSNLGPYAARPVTPL